MDDEMKDYKTDVGDTLSTDDQTAKSLVSESALSFSLLKLI
jgi:hypothetical protein